MRWRLFSRELSAYIIFREMRRRNIYTTGKVCESRLYLICSLEEFSSKHENLKSDVYGERIQARYFIAKGRVA
jgi:hypothetical protein